MPFKNYYKILGVAPNADEQTIRRKFRELARQYHPDANKTANPSRFHEINEAYQVLTDYDKRSKFDRELRERNTVSRSGGTSTVYVRPERPAPNPQNPSASHRRPIESEPVEGPIHDMTPTTIDAFAGVSLLVGVITCGLLAFVLVQVVNLLAGDMTTVRYAPTLTGAELATITQEAATRATVNAVPTLPPRRDFDLTSEALSAGDPLYSVIHDEIPALNNVCVVDVGEYGSGCNTANISSIASARTNTALTRIEFDRTGSPTALRRAIFKIEFDTTPRGFTVNIGDSRSNNGRGERASSGDPRYNAEIVISDGDLYIYGFSPDCTELASTLLHYEPDIVSAGSTFYIEVQDQVIRWIDESTFQVHRLESRCGFAIGGQTIRREQADNQIYAAFNRTVQSSTSSSGSGVGSVTIYVLAGSD